MAVRGQNFVSPEDVGRRVSFQFELTTPACPVKDQFLVQAQQLVGSIPGVQKVNCTMTSQVRTTV